MRKFALVFAFLLLCGFTTGAEEVSTTVIKQSFLSQTSISTTLFTPTVTGIYRISMFIESTSSMSGAPNGHFSYTASSGSVTTNNTCVVDDTHTASCMRIIRPTANNAVSISITSDVTYDAYVVVEKIF